MRWFVVFFGLLLAGACILSAAGDPEVKVGGNLLKIPGPTPDFIEAGDKLRTTLFELLAPSTNRLLTAYLPSRALEDMRAGKSNGAMELYAMTEVSRQAEYMDCSAQDFAQVLKSLEPALGSLDAAKVGQLQDEMNMRLKSLDVGRIELGRPQMLGGVFQKQDASGFAMLTAIKQGDRNTTLAVGMAVLRVKQRLMYGYLYRRYESPATVTWLRTALEAWSDAILANNK